MEKQHGNYEIRNRKNTARLLIWTIMWVITVAVATFGPKFIWNEGSWLSPVIILVNLGIGVGMILVNRIYLLGLDELQKKIQMESMAITLGVGLIGGISYSLLDTVNIISYDAEIGHLIMLMGITYIAGAVYGTIRHK